MFFNNSTDNNLFLHVQNTTTNYENFFEILEGQEAARMIEIIITPIILTFGSVGNIMSFIILRSGDLKKISTCFYMSILALIDTGNFFLTICPTCL